MKWPQQMQLLLPKQTYIHTWEQGIKGQIELKEASVLSNGSQTAKLAFLCAFGTLLSAYKSLNSCNKSPRTTLSFFTILINDAQALGVNLLVFSNGVVNERTKSISTYLCKIIPISVVLYCFWERFYSPRAQLLGQTQENCGWCILWIYPTNVWMPFQHLTAG